MYCVLCLNDEPTAHEHRPKMIVFQNSSIKEEWLAIRKEVVNKVAPVKQWLATYQALLNLLSAYDPKLQSEINALFALEKNVSDYY